MQATRTLVDLDAIRAEMARKRVTQQALAQPLGLSRAALGRRLLGEVPLSADQLAIIARKLSVTIDALITGEALAEGGEGA